MSQDEIKERIDKMHSYAQAGWFEGAAVVALSVGLPASAIKYYKMAGRFEDAARIAREAGLTERAVAPQQSELRIMPCPYGGTGTVVLRQQDNEVYGKCTMEHRNLTEENCPKLRLYQTNPYVSFDLSIQTCGYMRGWTKI